MYKRQINNLISKINKISSSKTCDFVDDIPSDLIIIDKTPTPIIKQSVKALNEQINRIVTSINKTEIPYIELNSIIKCVNDLSNYYNLNCDIQPIEKPGSGLLIISPRQETFIPLSLKSGNQIMLTTRNFDLSIFTKPELIEILEGINAIVTDDRYDTLRTKITKEISER